MKMISPQPGGQKGFTLIEVMIAITIFAIGMLAMAKMQINSIQGNYGARGTTEASTLAQSKVEELRSLPFGSAALIDTDGDLAAGLNDATAATADGNQQVTIYGTNYTIFWNVVNNSPNASSTTIRVIVAWLDRARARTLSMDCVRTNLFM